MGYWVAGIGACAANDYKNTIVITGDGSLQMNLQELQTIVHHKLPVKVFVLDNAGYLSIRSTQNNFFGRLVGAGPSSGVSFPNMLDVARAFGIPAIEIEGRDFEASLSSVLASQGPCVGVVRLDPQQGFEPRSSSKSLPDGRIVSAPLEDMYPFLERDELRSNLFIEEWKN